MKKVTKTAKKTASKPEYRGPKLINAIRSAIPGAGFVKVEPNGRKAFFEFHCVDFVVSSRLIVKECGFGRYADIGICDSEASIKLTERIKDGIA